VFLNFFNHGGLGDIHVSRTFIKDIINQSNINITYYTNHSSEIIKDIPVSHSKIENWMDRSMKMECISDKIYFNTWYGHQTHTILQTLYNNFTPLYNKIGIEQKSLIYYIPQIEYNIYNIKNIDNFIKDDKRYVLICNNNVNSGQSINYDFDYIINDLSESFPYFIFIISNSTSIKKSNVIQFDEIVKFNYNLNEISYLSTKCDYIIGRNSGPHTFCYVKENMDRNCVFISSVHKEWRYFDFGLSKIYNNVKFYNVPPTFDVLNGMKEIINL